MGVDPFLASRGGLDLGDSIPSLLPKIPTPGSKPEAYLCHVRFYCDNKRHLVCIPYSKDNLHLMASSLGINRCWFHSDHYDIPKRRIGEITARCTLVDSRVIVGIINRTITTVPASCE